MPKFWTIVAEQHKPPSLRPESIRARIWSPSFIGGHLAYEESAASLEQAADKAAEYWWRTTLCHANYYVLVCPKTGDEPDPAGPWTAWKVRIEKRVEAVAS